VIEKSGLARAVPPEHYDPLPAVNDKVKPADMDLGGVGIYMFETAHTDDGFHNTLAQKSLKIPAAFCLL
jgi:hypothetical protein